MVNPLAAALLPPRARTRRDVGPTARPVTRTEHRGLYERPDSFTDLLPWMEYDPESRVFLLEDGLSVGALLEITPAATEAQSGAELARLRDNLQSALTDAMPGRTAPPGCCSH